MKKSILNELIAAAQEMRFIITGGIPRPPRDTDDVVDRFMLALSNAEKDRKKTQTKKKARK